MNADVIGNKDGFLIRLAKAEDVTDYYEHLFTRLVSWLAPEDSKVVFGSNLYRLA